MIKLHNTLTKQKEEFKPLRKGKIGIYSCGPTVYDRQHIGNLRSAVIWDILRRVFEFNHYEVEYVVNITDFGHLTSDADEGEDKMAKGLKREGLPFTLDSMRKLAEKYAKLYLEDREKLNTLSPTHLPYASDHIKEDVEMIKALEEKSLSYVTSDGVYFDTSKDSDYGKLGGLTKEEEGRINTNPEKRNSRDFALWKRNDEIGWDSPWGKGFPGWHIECSAMSQRYLGETFDIHTGGIEHIPVHHNNEIAQSESVNEKPMANYWLHNEHLILKDGKMAKSVGNIITLADIEEKGFSPLALRLLFLQAHYRSPIEFSWEALEASQNALERLQERVSGVKDTGSVNKEYIEKFKKMINDDLDTPKGLTVVWEVQRDSSISDEDKKTTILEMDKVLGLGLSSLSPTDIPDDIKKLVEEREKVRKEGDFSKADELRKEIEKVGFSVRDTDNGPRTSRIKN